MGSSPTAGTKINREAFASLFIFIVEVWDENRFHAARMSAAGDGLTEPLLDFIESHCRHQKRPPLQGWLFLVSARGLERPAQA